MAIPDAFNFRRVSLPLTIVFQGEEHVRGRKDYPPTVNGADSSELLSSFFLRIDCLKLVKFELKVRRPEFPASIHLEAVDLQDIFMNISHSLSGN
jgi:hypothetical protein